MPYDLDSIDENTTDEQIEQLLQSAERRLRNNGQLAHSHTPNTNAPSKYDWALKVELYADNVEEGIISAEDIFPGPISK